MRTDKPSLPSPMAKRHIFHSIKTLIIGSIVSLMLIFIGTGVFSIIRIHIMNESASLISAEIKALGVLGRMKELSQELRALASLTHNARNSEERQTYLEETQKAQKAFSAAWSTYAPTISDEAERNLSRRLRQAWQHFLAIEGEVAALDRAGEEDLANDTLSGRFRLDSIEFRNAVNDVLEFREQRAFGRTAETNAIGADSRIAVMIALTGATVIAIATGCLILMRVASPIAAMTHAMRRLSENDLQVEIPGQDRQDEIGVMAEAVYVFRNNIERNQRLESEAALSRASVEEQRRHLMHKMAEEFERAVGGIAGTVSSAATELQATAHSMMNTAAQTATQSSGAASAADQAATNVGAVAAAAEQLGSSISEIARQVAGSAKLAVNAETEADQTASLVGQLQDAVAKIGDVTGLISNIAGQTNLLALNATIEAARAGSAGRGFAVVAAEVKNLASQTAHATSEISDYVQRVQNSTSQAVAAISSIAARIREINGVAANIAASVEEQGAATQEIVRSVSQAAVGTSEVNINIDKVADAAKETGAASAQVLASASDVSKQAERLNFEVTRFLQNVRAA